MSSSCESAKLWLENAARYPVLPKDEVIRLGNIIQNPDSSPARRKQAITKLVRHNLRLIPVIVRRCMASKRSYTYMGEYTDDFFQCGAVGLTRAAELFDPTRGYAFSTYAGPWIFQAVQREMYNGVSLVRVPENTIREVYKFYGDKDTSFEDLKPVTRDRFMSAMMAMNCLSLDSKVETAEDLCLLETVASPVQDDYSVLDLMLAKAKLNSKQRQIIAMKYQYEMSEIGIAEELGVERYDIQKNLKMIRKELSEVMS